MNVEKNDILKEVTDEVVKDITSDTIKKIADKIVKDIVRDISDRSGLDNEWGSIDDDIKREIKSTWKKIIEKHLTK